MEQRLHLMLQTKLNLIYLTFWRQISGQIDIIQSGNCEQATPSK